MKKMNINYDLIMYVYENRSKTMQTLIQLS